MSKNVSPDGKKIVCRVWGNNDSGLRIMNIEDRSVEVLTTEYDNLPFWSLDGSQWRAELLLQIRQDELPSFNFPKCIF